MDRASQPAPIARPLSFHARWAGAL